MSPWSKTLCIKDLWMWACWLSLGNFWTEYSEARSIFISQLRSIGWAGTRTSQISSSKGCGGHNRRVTLSLSDNKFDHASAKYKPLFQIRIFPRFIYFGFLFRNLRSKYSICSPLCAMTSLAAVAHNSDLKDLHEYLQNQVSDERIFAKHKHKHELW